MLPTPTAAFDLDASNKTIGDAIAGSIKVMLPLPGSAPLTPEDGQAFMKTALEAFGAGSKACNEVGRLRGALAGLRDKHRPRPSVAPSAPGAICAACSLHGAIVAWPCETWTDTEHALSHGQN